MKPEGLLPYARLYRRGHTAASGAADLFNAWAGLPAGGIVPLSLSHGVDFGHCRQPQDIGNVEPIHWCYNERIHARAAPLKPALLAPHPWILLIRSAPVARGAGTLVVGPPPGPANDRGMLDLLRRHAPGPATILVKQSGQHEASRRFWRDRGYEVTGVAPRGGALYASLFALLARFETVIGFTFSSALVFAAALGRDARLLPGYRYRSYFPSDYFGIVDFTAPAAREVVATFRSADAARKAACAGQLLGADLAVTGAEARQQLAARIGELGFALHGLRGAPAWCKSALFRLAAALDAPALARLDRETLEKLAGRREVLDLEIDETAMWAEGPGAASLVARTRRYVAGETEPGTAVERYASAAGAS